MDKQQKDKIFQFFEMYSGDISSHTEITSTQVEQYLQELGKKIIDCNKEDNGAGYTINIHKRFFKKEYSPELDIPDIYAEMIKNISENSKNNITIKSGRYELHISNKSKKSKTYPSFIQIPGDKKFETKEFDNPYDAGKEFAELVGVNVLRGLNIPSISDIINLFKN